MGRALVMTLPPGNLPDELVRATGASGPRRSVVIIDEIDEAPRDVPNDILHELESMQFRIHEAGLTISGNRNLVPIAVFTSNSERSLPDAFLRRCVFHHIHAPSHGQLREIIGSRLQVFATGGSRLLDAAIEVCQR